MNQNHINWAPLLLGLVISLVAICGVTLIGLHGLEPLSLSIVGLALARLIFGSLFKREFSSESILTGAVVSSVESVALGAALVAPTYLLAGFETLLSPLVLSVIIVCALVNAVWFSRSFVSFFLSGESLPFPESQIQGLFLNKNSFRDRGWALPLSIVLFFLFALISHLKNVALWKLFETTFIFGGTVWYLGGVASVSLTGLGLFVPISITIALVVGNLTIWCGSLPYLAHIQPNHSDGVAWYWQAWKVHGRSFAIGLFIIGVVWCLFKNRAKLFQSETQDKLPSISPALTGFLSFIANCAVFYWLSESILLSLVGTFLTCTLSLITNFCLCYWTGIAGRLILPLGIPLLFGSFLQPLLHSSGFDSGQSTLITISALLLSTISGLFNSSLLNDIALAKQSRTQTPGILWSKLIAGCVAALYFPFLFLKVSAVRDFSAPLAQQIATFFQGISIITPFDKTFLIVGGLFGVLIIFVDEVLRARNSRFRIPVLVVSLGAGLPFSWVVPLAVGALLSTGLQKKEKALYAVKLIAVGLVLAETLVRLFVAYASR